MTTNDNQIVDDELESVEEIEETKDEFENDTTDWKALALKNQGIAKRYQTKLQKRNKADTEKAKADLEKEKQSQNKKEDKKDFDYAEKAYLKAMGIEKDEFPFVKEAMQSTGKSLDEILDSKYFQSELKEKREEKASQDAIPSGTKRSGGSARDSVEYWLAKGEMPPEDQPKLRREVVNARIAAEERKTKFTDRPVV